jgi:hypothetical protein
MKKECVLIWAVLLLLNIAGFAKAAESHTLGHKMWYMGRIISVGPGQFSFRTHWHPNRTVHVSADTVVRCGKSLIGLESLRPEDLVEISARSKGEVIYGNIIKLHVKAAECQVRRSQVR